MKLELTAEQLAFQQEVKSFVDREIIPVANKLDQEEETPLELIAKVAQQGYLSAMLPVEFGGRGLDMISIGILNEEIGRGCSSIRSLLTVHGMVSLAIWRWGTKEQKQKWLPKLATGDIIGAFGLTEPNIGTDAKNVELQAVLEGDHYVLNGRKKWITYGQIADLFLMFGQCEGKPTAFLVESSAPGFSRQPLHGILGTRGSMLAELHLESCTIPHDQLLGRPGFGLTYVATSCLDYGRYTIAWGCVGIGQACLDDSLRYSSERIQFGQPLRENQLIQKMITEMVANVKAARQLCFKAAYLKDVHDPDGMMETWIAKYFASTMLGKITSDAIQIHGANGCSQDYNVQRYFRDAKVMEIIEGTTQMHEILIAANAYNSVM